MPSHHPRRPKALAGARIAASQLWLSAAGPGTASRLVDQRSTALRHQVRPSATLRQIPLPQAGTCCFPALHCAEVSKDVWFTLFSCMASTPLASRMLVCSVTCTLQDCESVLLAAGMCTAVQTAHALESIYYSISINGSPNKFHVFATQKIHTYLARLKLTGCESQLATQCR